MRTLIILFGPPGSGKGLLGDKLVEQGQMLKVATGDILRNAVKQQTPLGIKIARSVKSGILVDDDIVNPIVKKALDEASGNIILDGYPRRLSQLITLKGWCQQAFEPLCVYMTTPINDILSRISQRRICELCGTTHFAAAGCCPKCGGRSVVREDDALITQRLNDYLKTVDPLIDMIDQWCRVIPVNGMDITNGVQNILACLKSF